MSRDSFFDACLHGVEMSLDRKVQLINDNGKTRTVTVATAFQQTLLPLHILLYNHLSNKDWLLRGDATANCFKQFERKEGEVFVSGDYESATDNFNSHHSRNILSLIFENSSSIPVGIQQQAIRSLTGSLLYKGNRYPQIAGQLMGNLLSFPLLCLTNFLAFKYAVRRKVPLMINGDDIVFRCTPVEADKWFKTIGDSGLVVSRGKTLVHGKFFSLNSTFFESRWNRKPSLVPVIRSKAIFAPVDSGSSIGARMISACRGFWSDGKSAIRESILRFHRKAAANMGCSVSRGLGITVGASALAGANLVSREIYYLGMDSKVDVPTSKKSSPLKGWKQVPVRYAPDGWSEDYGEACRTFTWSGGRQEESIEPPLVGWQEAWWDSKILRMMRISGQALRRLNYSRVPKRVWDWIDGRKRKGRRGAQAWVPEDSSCIGVPMFVAALQARSAEA